MPMLINAHSALYFMYFLLYFGRVALSQCQICCFIQVFYAIFLLTKGINQCLLYFTLNEPLLNVSVI